MSKTCHLPIHRNTFWSLLQLYLRILVVSIPLHQKEMNGTSFRTSMMTTHFSKWILLPISITPKVCQALFPCIHTRNPFVSLIRLIRPLLLHLLFQQDTEPMVRSLIQFTTNILTPIPIPPTLPQICSCLNLHKSAIRNPSFFFSHRYVPFRPQTPTTPQYRSAELPTMATAPLSVPKKNTVKAKFVIDIDKVLSGEEKRHTVMLRNIPNR